MRWMVLFVVFLAGCTQVPAGPVFSSDAEHVAVLVGSDPCHAGVCWAGGTYHPVLDEAGLDLVLRFEEPPQQIRRDGDMYYWLQPADDGADVFAFDAVDQWLYTVWDHADGHAYDLHAHNGTVSFVTSDNGTAAGPAGETVLRTWSIEERGGVIDVPMDGPFSLLAFGGPGWVLAPWLPESHLHAPEAYLLYRGGWLEEVVDQSGGPATMDAAFIGDILYTAINQWGDGHYAITESIPFLGVRSAVRGGETGAVDLVAGKQRLAYVALDSMDDEPEVRELHLDASKEVAIGPGRPAAYVHDTLVLTRQLHDGELIEQHWGVSQSSRLVGNLPGFDILAVAGDDNGVVVQVDGPFHALAELRFGSVVYVE